MAGYNNTNNKEEINNNNNKDKNESAEIQKSESVLWLLSMSNNLKFDLKEEEEINNYSLAYIKANFSYCLSYKPANLKSYFLGSIRCNYANVYDEEKKANINEHVKPKDELIDRLIESFKKKNINGLCYENIDDLFFEQIFAIVKKKIDYINSGSIKETDSDFIKILSIFKKFSEFEIRTLFQKAKYSINISSQKYEELTNTFIRFIDENNISYMPINDDEVFINQNIIAKKELDSLMDKFKYKKTEEIRAWQNNAG
jgi:hypothetical protein